MMVMIVVAKVAHTGTYWHKYIYIYIFADELIYYIYINIYIIYVYTVKQILQNLYIYKYKDYSSNNYTNISIGMVVMVVR